MNELYCMNCNKATVRVILGGESRTYWCANCQKSVNAYQKIAPTPAQEVGNE